MKDIGLPGPSQLWLGAKGQHFAQGQIIVAHNKTVERIPIGIAEPDYRWVLTCAQLLFFQQPKCWRFNCFEMTPVT